MRILIIFSYLTFYLFEGIMAGDSGSEVQGSFQNADIQHANFKCPGPFGQFADPEDCTKFYFCFFKKAGHKTCPKGHKFCVKKSACVRDDLAVCANKDQKTSVIPTENTASPTQTPAERVTQPRKFKCPAFGNFPDPNDCSKYYSCGFLVKHHKSCPAGQKFDVGRRTCVQEDIADCGNNEGKPTKMISTTTTTSLTTTSPVPTTGDLFKCPTYIGLYPHAGDCSRYYECTSFEATLKTCAEGQLFDAVRMFCNSAGAVHCGDRPMPDTFKCPTYIGLFPHARDCSRYYECTSFEATLKTCPEGKLFDAVRMFCNAAGAVHCGDRYRPDMQTTTTTTTTTEEPTTTTTEEPTTTTTEEPTTTPTTTLRPTGPPETDCLEGDDDCLIDKMGDPNVWFKCPGSFGSYPHPSSDRLFIFCKNLVPKVKKCGMKMVFSKTSLTCTVPQ